MLIEAMANLAALLSFASTTTDQVDPEEFSRFLRQRVLDVVELAVLAKSEFLEWSTALDQAYERLGFNPPAAN